MVDWRLLLFVVFGIFQPISSDQTLINGKETCCLKFPQSLGRDTRFSETRPDGFSKTTPADGRMNVRETIRSVRAFGTDPTYRLSTTRRSLDRNFRHRIEDLQHQARKRVGEIRDITTRSKNSARSDISVSSGREENPEQLRRSRFVSESRRQIEDRIITNKRIFIQRTNNQERRLNDVNNIRNGLKEQSERQRRSIHESVRNARSLAYNRENLDRSAYIRQSRTRSNEYSRDFSYTRGERRDIPVTRDEHRESSMTHSERRERIVALSERNRNDDANRRTRLNRITSVENLNKDLTRTRVAANSQRRAHRDFIPHFIRDSNRNNDRQVRNENRRELKRTTRPDARMRDDNTKIVRNSYRAAIRGNDYIARSEDRRNDRFDNRKSDRALGESTARFEIKNARQNNRHLINRFNSAVDRNDISGFRAEKENRNVINNRRFSERGNRNTVNRIQDVRTKPQRDLNIADGTKQELINRRYSDNRDKTVSRIDNSRHSELRTQRRISRESRPSTRDSLSDLRNDVIRNKRSVMDTTKINKQQSVLERDYLIRPIADRVMVRQDMTERKSRSILEFTRNTFEIITPGNTEFELKLHHLLYVIQGIYLLGILIKMSSNDKQFPKKNRINSWLTTRMALKMD